MLFVYEFLYVAWRGYPYHEENIAKGGLNSNAKRLAVKYVEAQD